MKIKNFVEKVRFFKKRKKEKYYTFVQNKEMAYQLMIVHKKIKSSTKSNYKVCKLPNTNALSEKHLIKY